MQRSLHSGNPVVNILIAESNRMNCQLIETALRPKRHHVAVVARAVGSAQALSLLDKTKPDVALVSAQLDESPLEGYRLLREIRGSQSRTRAVMLLSSRDPGVLIDTFRSGAHGVVFRDESLETLSKCIHAVNQGQVWANSQQLGYVLEALTRAMPLHLRDANGASLLAKHEEDVVRLVADGMTNREVSRQLNLSEHTVRNYVSRVFDKLGVSSRVELVLYCLQEKQKGFKRLEAAGN